MRKLFKTSSLLIMFISSLFSLSSALDILAPGQLLSDNETLVSANGTFALGFFTPNSTSKNSYIGIWYNKISIQTVVWVANRNNPISAHSIASLSISANGILTITAGNSTVIWSSALPTYNVSNPIAQLLDTGNFVVRDVNSFNPEFFYAWQSFDYPTDALLPGMKLGVNLKRGLNRSLTAWASLTDPSFGSQSAQYFMDIHGDPQIFLSSGPARTWRTGSWNGHNLVGVPEMKTYGLFIFQFVQNSEEVYYQYWMKDTSVVSRLLVTPSGSVNRLVWNNQVKTWDLFWYKPKDQCDSLSQCGPFGVCDVGNSPVCSCVQGFVPRDPLNWALREGSDGCIRKTKLDCKNGTDGFVTVSEAKLPDTSNSTVDWSLSLDQCRARCLRNCSCTAYASADVNGTGCLIWTTNLTDLRTWSFGGQDVYVRLAAADLGPITSDQFHRKRLLPVVIIAATILGLLLLACISCLCIKKQKIRLAKLPTISFANPYKSEGLQSKDLELPLFDLSTIMVATDNFSIQNKLGEGGFGPVFKGILEDGQIIAVKRLAKSSGQGIDEFKNEMILIAKLQHRNLVRLLGCCVHGEERMLVYEYMPNKSLDVFLFDQAKSTVLDWKTRQKIIMGIIRGLLYLHHDSRLRIIHRDLKASNILLDMEMNPKISDFGMARIFGGDDMDFNTKKVVGTYGYMSPEYAMEGIFSVKSDVFSFGVLLLEIISGTKNRGSYAFSSHLNLVGHVWSLWNEDKSLQMVDESISNSFPKYEVLKYIKIGLLCVQEHPEDRPLLSSVIQMLGSEITSLPQPKQPGFIARFIRLEKDPYLSEQGTASNEISVSTMEGR